MVDVVLYGRFAAAFDELRYSRRGALQGRVHKQAMQERRNPPPDYLPDRVAMVFEHHPVRAAPATLLDVEGKPPHRHQAPLRTATAPSL